MDKRTEEKISQLAFGELSEKETAEVRAWAAQQPEVSATLEAYESMRQDLRRLRDVPPDQLSKERLQNAILAGGLKPKPVRTGISWLWVPGAAMSVILGFFLLSRLPSGTKPMIEAPSDRNLSVVILNEDDVSMANKLRQSLGNPVSLDESGLRIPAPTASPQDDTAAVVAAEASVSRAAPLVRMRAYRPRTAAAPKMDSTPMVPTKAPSHGPLVIIQSGQDANTGAQSAVEVSQTEDVIVSS